MAIYTISDLHLPLGVNKPMDIFGSRWSNYVEKLKENWLSTVSPEDTVVLGGDFSWAMYLEEAIEDFKFIHSLPGKKFLLKGNHDYWWTTMNKLNSFLLENEWTDISFLHNNYLRADSIAICGTRGWTVPQGKMSAEDEKIYARELLRLKSSIEKAKADGLEDIFVFLHFPPLLKDFRDTEFTRLLEDEKIKNCYFGHLHGPSEKNAYQGEQNGVKYTLCSCDSLNFIPLRVK